ncbi:Phosphorylated carbohydrates phosphatase [Pseudoalteromonas holothuriae]|uniref:Phosphorylated carbohydrates phosphatase n=1 Tax=Pseudoalteromonas holothuriae TaxID=2963714 RepID=A0A9W4VRJ3_9GAMM|nr:MULTISPECIES: HAD family phosphatase [unclassified Pseudoalteromonas]CAH9059577.1 Phosphorylated carbohydrates phosphatase [Pseudoalteromonas sp. CIP111854]CAH9064248.1 Phosphorylated carbohydrates phosphatase [Pseudoalteromonas sp. CIP111951]
MSLQAILFDFDGTLVDSEVLHYQSWMQVLAPWNIHYDELSFCDEFSGVPSLQAADILNQRHGLNRQPEALTEQKNRLFVDVAATLSPKLMPFAKEILAQASKQFTLALVTGSTRAEALPVLAHYQLDKLFQYIVCKDDVANAKPHPEPYSKALTHLSLTASQALAIEDTQTGLASATSAGLKTIVVPNHHSKQQDLSKATYQVQNLQAAWQQIQQLI